MASTSNDKEVYVADEDMEMEAQAGSVGEYSLHLLASRAKLALVFLEIKLGRGCRGARRVQKRAGAHWERDEPEEVQNGLLDCTGVQR
jgi:hypothetical protein